MPEQREREPPEEDAHADADQEANMLREQDEADHATNVAFENQTFMQPGPRAFPESYLGLNESSYRLDDALDHPPSEKDTAGLSEMSTSEWRDKKAQKHKSTTSTFPTRHFPEHVDPTDGPSAGPFRPLHSTDTAGGSKRPSLESAELEAVEVSGRGHIGGAAKNPALSRPTSPHSGSASSSVSVEKGSAMVDFSQPLSKEDEWVITMQSLSYYVPRKKQRAGLLRKKKSAPLPEGEDPKRLYILRDINGIIRTGQMTMIMGASGSGKSTLLDVIAGRKTYGTVEGELLFNGQPRPYNFRRLCGYVEQADILLGTLTPRELLHFTAKMKLPANVTTEEIHNRVSFVLSTLGLEHCADTIIGNLRLRGISGGEAKRVNIGLELLTRPAILFLDEPTSGLDASTAVDLMMFVRKISHTGTGVLCTIHQPSKEIFELFDRLMLLAAGGIAFFGPTCESVRYFTDMGYVFEDGTNPADVVVEILSGSTRIQNTLDPQPKAEKFFLEKYAQSRFAEERLISTQTAVQEQQEHVRKNEAAAQQPLFVNSMWFNANVLLQRNARKARRNGDYWRNRVIIPTVVAILLLLIYVDSPRDFRGVRNRQALIMLTVTFFTIGTNQLISDFIEERIVFTRERNAATYQVSSYYLGYGLLETPTMIIKAILWINLIYWATPFSYDVGNYFFFLLVGVILADAGLASAQFFAYYFSGVETAVTAMIIFSLINLIFSGFFIRKRDIPNGWIWAYYLSFCNYAIAALVINEFTSTSEYSEPSSLCIAGSPQDLCPVPGTGGNCFTDEVPIPRDDILTFVGASTSGFFSSKWANLLLLVICWALLRLAAYLALRFKKHGRR